MKDTRNKILETAESLIRTGGYNAFSFREIASAIGIKSSSVHHHFPTKEDLAVAVAERYSAAFFELLKEPAPEGRSYEDQLEHYSKVFQQAFVHSRQACLCGILANQASMLPPKVRETVLAFVEKNVVWLKAASELPGSAVPAKQAEVTARLVYCALEGAIGVASLADEDAWQESVSEMLLTIVAKKG